jgi:hypothetical protein
MGAVALLGPAAGTRRRRADRPRRGTRGLGVGLGTHRGSGGLRRGHHAVAGAPEGATHGEAARSNSGEQLHVN